MALVLSLSVLLAVTAAALTLLQIGTLEPQISRNLADAARARELADAGVEVAYARLGGAGGLGAILVAADPRNPWVTLTEAAPIDGPESGTYRLRLRNDHDPDDRALTGLPAGPDAGETEALDVNGVLIVRSSGAFRRARVTVEAVFRWSPEGLSLYNRREVP